MIDLFSLWLGGFMLVMVMNCTIVKEISREFAHGPTILVIMAVAWPILTLLVLWMLLSNN